MKVKKAIRVAFAEDGRIATGSHDDTQVDPRQSKMQDFFSTQKEKTEQYVDLSCASVASPASPSSSILTWGNMISSEAGDVAGGAEAALSAAARGRGISESSDTASTAPDDFHTMMKDAAQTLKAITEESRRRDSQRDGTDQAVMPQRDAKQKEVLQQALSADNIDVRSAVWAKFARNATTGIKHNYKQLKTDADRKAFRLDWARRELDTLTHGKRHERSWQRVDTERGRYMTLAKIAEEFGYNADPERAMAGAIKYAKKCAALGGKWTWEDTEFSEMSMYLYLNREFREDLTQSWTMYEEYIGRQDKDAKQQVSDQSEGKTPYQEVSEKIEGKKPDHSKDNQSSPRIQDQVDKAKTGLEKALADAKHWKGRFLAAVAKASALKKSMVVDKSYAKVNSPDNFCDLEQALNAFESKTFELGCDSVLQQDVTAIKKAFGKEHLQVILEKFNGLAPDITALEAVHSRIIKMYVASRSIP